MDAHDRIETLAPADRHIRTIRRLIGFEREMAALIGWSHQRVVSRGCQLWGELRHDDRFDDPFSGMESCPSCRRAIGSAEVHQCPGDRFAKVTT